MKLKHIIFVCFSLLGLASCSEKDDTIQEFPEDWAAQNDIFFQQLLTQAQDKKAAGDTSWDYFVSYTKPSQNYSYRYYDYVVVEKLENGSGTQSPLLTDNVKIHYVGRLRPSANKYKTEGMIFDRSYDGVYDPAYTPAEFSVNAVIAGFGTTLIHMHKGDHWRVYIPYQLGYGSSGNTTIPGGSTLIFDLRLIDFYQ